MASASISMTVQSTPPANHHITLPATRPSAHARKHSRKPSTSLPAFSFHPGVSEQHDIENQPSTTPDEPDAASHARQASKLAALPDFKFNPGADMPEDSRSTVSHPVLEEMVMNQQRVSRSARPAPLPAFTFNPNSSGHLTPSPSKSEFGDAGPTKPAAGHKRAGSEFVGTLGVDGPTMVSTSPQRPDTRTAGPPVSVGGRRGHQHRRSQAISITDIDTSDLIRVHALAKTRSGSAPATPSTSTPALSLADHSPTVGPTSATQTPPASPRRRESMTGPRPRVEFAEKIDVIPRPLSMISSGTEGSCSTARYSHSLSNSINSIASPSHNLSPVTSPIPEEVVVPPCRPRTADATLFLSTAPARVSDTDSPASHTGICKRPLSSGGCVGSPLMANQPAKKKHFWFGSSPDRLPPAVASTGGPDPISVLPTFAPCQAHPATRPKTSPERSDQLGRRKKYPTWTGSIFKKSSKRRDSRSQPGLRTAPAVLHRRRSDQVNEIFDADDTVVLRSESPEARREQRMPDAGPVLTASRSVPADSTAPVLDLDAALALDDSDESSGGDNGPRTAASRIAKLHSSERRGVMDAFGVIHRRTESAPSMPAFNRSAFTLSHQSSNPSLGDVVFDEEEEDNFLADQRQAQRRAAPAPLGRRTSPPGVHSPSPSTDADGLGLSYVSPRSDAVVIVDLDEDVEAGDRSSKSTLEASIIADEMPKRPATSPLTFGYPSMPSHYASSTEGRTTTSTSMISSPDPDHLHFDQHARRGPPYNFNSPDFALRPSNEDLPSLSDSISSGAVPRGSSSANTRSSVDQRPDERATRRSVSMFVTDPPRPNSNWKRSSLASLNRLIPGSANGSKLKFETTPESSSVDDQVTKRKSAHRLSRLVGFWRGKKEAGHQ